MDSDDTALLQKFGYRIARTAPHDAGPATGAYFLGSMATLLGHDCAASDSLSGLLEHCEQKGIIRKDDNEGRTTEHIRMTERKESYP